MKIHFRDVQTGMVEARAVIELEPGVYLNEVTLLNIDGQLVVEFPRKNFKGKDDRTHHLDIITFENEDKQVLWELQIKEAYRSWRKDNKKVLVYEDKPAVESSDERPPRRPYKERSYDDKPRGERSYGDRKPREYSDRSSRPGHYDKPYGDRKPRAASDREGRYGSRDKPSGERRSYDDKPRRERTPRQETSSYDKPSRGRSTQSDKPRRQSTTGASAKPRSVKSSKPVTKRNKK